MSPTVVKVTLGWPLVLSTVLVAFVSAASWPLAMDGAWAWYDRIWPVATGEIHSITRDERGDLRVDITIAKHRDCERTTIYGYTYKTGAKIDRAVIDRPGGPAGVGFLRAGESIRSTWRVVDSKDAVGGSLRIEHLCAGRSVVSNIAEVPPWKLKEYLR